MPLSEIKQSHLTCFWSMKQEVGIFNEQNDPRSEIICAAFSFTVIIDANTQIQVSQIKRSGRLQGHQLALHSGLAKCQGDVGLQKKILLLWQHSLNLCRQSSDFGPWGVEFVPVSPVVVINKTHNLSRLLRSTEEIMLFHLSNPVCSISTKAGLPE